jgi:hypothetical protein
LRAFVESYQITGILFSQSQRGLAEMDTQPRTNLLRHCVRNKDEEMCNIGGELVAEESGKIGAGFEFTQFNSGHWVVYSVQSIFDLRLQQGWL